MRNALFAACAAIVVTAAAVGASAAQFTVPPSGSGTVVRVDDNRYYDDGYYDNSGYQNRGYYYDDSQRGWSNDSYGGSPDRLAAMDRAKPGAE